MWFCGSRTFSYLANKLRDLRCTFSFSFLSSLQQVTGLILPWPRPSLLYPSPCWPSLVVILSLFSLASRLHVRWHRCTHGPPWPSHTSHLSWPMWLKAAPAHCTHHLAWQVGPGSHVRLIHSLRLGTVSHIHHAATPSLAVKPSGLSRHPSSKCLFPTSLWIRHKIDPHELVVPEIMVPTPLPRLATRCPVLGECHRR